MAAIAALTPNPSKPENEEPSSPTSPTSTFSEEEVPTWRQRRSSNAGSFDSSTSAASSATSFNPDTDMDFSPVKSRARYAFPQPPRANSPSLCQVPTVTISPIPSPLSNKLATETASFTSMLHNHLSSVQSLKEKTSVPSVRFQFPSPKASPTSKPSPTMARARCSQWLEEDDGAMETIRRERRARVWRPRFDAGGVQRLCGEALGELQ